MMSERTNTVDVTEQLKMYHQRVDQALSGFLTALPSNHLIEAVRYGALLGGKRLRPYIVYTTGAMFGISLDNLDVPATAVECIHAYSLIHDDLPAMDNDDLRRGKATCHIEFGEANAILAGDALQTLAFSILADASMPDVAIKDRLAMISELATASGVAGMCGGQALDLAAAGRQISLESLEQIHRYKTGALIQAAVRLGAFAAGDRGRAALPALSRYAQAIGLAFQVQDDILNVMGDTTKMGKRQGSDQQMGKNTYPALLGIDNAHIKMQDLFTEALTALDSLTKQCYNTQPLRALAYFIIERDN